MRTMHNTWRFCTSGRAGIVAIELGIRHAIEMQLPAVLQMRHRRADVVSLSCNQYLGRQSRAVCGTSSTD